MLDVNFLNRAREVGADSFWFKDVSREELMNVVERTMQGESVYPDKTPEIRIGNASSYEFTEAEIKVLRVLVEGMTYKEMALALNVSVETVKTHIGSMLSKTGYTSKTKLVAMVMSKRLIVISGIPEIIEGAVFIRWNIWEPKEEDGFTMVGVQKGNTLTYTELGDTLLPVEQKIMDEKTY